MTPDKINIPQALRDYRQRLGLSQPQLAERWDMPVGTLRNWEQGARLPSPPGPILRLMKLDL